MEFVKDLKWRKGINLKAFVDQIGRVGFQSIELGKAANVFVKMKMDGAKIFLTFTSNMVTSGLRGFFAQVIKLGMVDVLVTTVGGIEEDIMKASGDKFFITSFYSDDIALHEKGMNRVGNLLIDNQSYLKFEDTINSILCKLYNKKSRWTPSEIFMEIGLMLDDESSILYQAARRNIPIYCPAITDGAFGFHLYLFQQKHKDFIVDVAADFGNIITKCGSFDDKKGLIALGGSISKHHAVLAGLVNGGFDYAVYMTTAAPSSGSMSGATTQEAKSWGKIKDDSDASTVRGDVSITFPLAMMYALEILSDRGILDGES